MMSSVDGRIVSERWSLSPAAEKQYEAVHALHRADAWLCGRETFQIDFLEQKRDAKFSNKTKVPSGDFIGTYPKPDKKAGKPVYAIAVDASGKLQWDSNLMRGDRFIVVTTKKAPSGYLADLRAKSISYFIGGARDIDFAAVLGRLHQHFGIRKVMLEGGGGINGAFLAAGLVDELSLLVAPEADGSQEVPTVFDIAKPALKKHGTPLRLISASKRPGGLLWLRYRAVK